MLKKSYFVLTLALVAIFALGACAPATPDCASEEVFCVGLVTDVGKIDDKSFNQSTWEGAQQSEEEGIADQLQYIETIDAKDYDKNIATFGDENYDVIVTVGFALGEATQKAAAIYPDIKFIGVDQFQAWEFDGDDSTNIANVTGLVFDEDKAGFLVGALAAMMSETGKIGGVAGTDAVPPVWRYGEGYRAGAAYIDPDVEVTVIYHSDVGFDKTFTDPEWGASTANSMIDKGVDVIFGIGGKTGNGGVIAAALRGVYGIGVDADQYFTLPEAAPRLLSSALKLLHPGTYGLIKLAKEGNFPSGNYSGPTGYAPAHDLADEVSAEVNAQMEDILAGILDGTITTGVPPVKPE